VGNDRCGRTRIAPPFSSERESSQYIPASQVGAFITWKVTRQLTRATPKAIGSVNGSLERFFVSVSWEGNLRRSSYAKSSLSHGAGSTSPIER
jgi:hypothetical protein